MWLLANPIVGYHSTLSNSHEIYSVGFVYKDTNVKKSFTTQHHYLSCPHQGSLTKWNTAFLNHTGVASGWVVGLQHPELSHQNLRFDSSLWLGLGIRSTLVKVRKRYSQFVKQSQQLLESLWLRCLMFRIRAHKFSKSCSVSWKRGQFVAITFCHWHRLLWLKLKTVQRQYI